MTEHTVSNRTKPIKWAALLVGLVLLLIVVPGAIGGGPVGVGAIPPAGDRTTVVQAAITGVAAPATIYEYPLSVGVEYIADYPGTASDLPCAANNAYGVYNTLRGSSWFGGSTSFIYGNGNAWEQDFKSTAAPGGGNKDNWIDNVDLAFYEGHGNPTLFTFETSTGAGTHDDSYLTYDDVNTRKGYRGWGSKDLEWLGLLSCSVLADSHEGDWSYAMDYLHLLMGFSTTAYDVCGFGQTFAQRVLAGNSIRDAWFIACDQKQPSGVVAKVLAEENYHLYESIYNQMPDHAQDATYWRSTKACGTTQPALFVDAAQVTAMPVFQTPPLNLAETESKWGQLTAAFEATPTVQMAAALQPGGYYTSTVGTHQLEMDSDTGLFYYVDNGTLFTPTAVTKAGILAPEAAKDVADKFLADNGLKPGDAQFAEVLPVNLDNLSKPITQSSKLPEVINSTVTDWEVIYSRVLTASAVSALATSETISYSVVGSGAKIKVYVHAAGGAAKVSAPGKADGAVVGAQGGWRRIETTTPQHGPQQVQTTPVLPFSQIEKLFQQLEPQVAYEHIPFDTPTSKAILTYTLGYWEEATGSDQDNLYPAYVLSATYTGTWGTVTGPTYLPVNPEYMRPFAKVESSSDLSKNYAPGQVVTMTAADASKTLAQLGYDASLNFALGKGSTYLYEWYRGSVAPANFIGTGRNLVYTVTMSSGQGAPMAQTIFLVVTDFNSSHSSRKTGLASAQLNVMPPVYLPMITKR